MIIINVYVSTCSVVETFVEAKPDCVYWKGFDGQTTLHSACYRYTIDTIKTVKFLIDKGANVNTK